MLVQVVARRFSADEYHRMAEARILREDDRVELLDGEVVEMAPIGSRHAACVTRLNATLSRRLAGRALVNVQNPIRLGEHSEPQPDIALLRTRADFYAHAHPTPEDVLLVVEVAETSEEYDREVKVPLYARWGIPEVWLVDLANQTIEVYRGASPTGYLDVRSIGSGQPLVPQAFPDLRLTVEDVLL